MKQTEKIVKKIEDNIRESNIADTILSILKTGLSFTKFGPFSSLISEFIPTKRFLRLEQFAQDLAQELNKVEDKIDVNFITTDEFAFIFEQCFKAASENYQKAKLDSFKAIIINSATQLVVDNDEREYYLNLTNSLTVLHLKILIFMNSPHKYLSDNNISENLISGGFGNFFPKVFPNIDIETIKMAFDDLYNYGLISNDKGIFHTMTASGGFDLLGDRVSINGKRFVDFITIE